MQCPYCKEEIIDGAIKCKHCGSTIGSRPFNPGGAEIGEQLNISLNIWKENLTDLVLMTLVFMLVAWIPIVNIGFIAGYTRSLLKVSRGKGKAQVGDIFNAWDCFGNLFVYLLLLLIASVVLHLIPVIGTLASLAIGFLAMPGMYAVIDGRKGAIDSIKWSIETIQANFVPWLLAYIVGTVISCAGFLLLIVGALLSLPLGQLVVIQQYDRSKPA